MLHLLFPPRDGSTSIGRRRLGESQLGGQEALDLAELGRVVIHPEVHGTGVCGHGAQVDDGRRGVIAVDPVRVAGFRRGLSRACRAPGR